MSWSWKPRNKYGGKDEKKYVSWRPLFKVKCIRYEDVEMLGDYWYNVIDETPTKYLIKFNNGGANWYSKKRFADKRIPFDA